LYQFSYASAYKYGSLLVELLSHVTGSHDARLLVLRFETLDCRVRLMKETVDAEELVELHAKLRATFDDRHPVVNSVRKLMSVSV